MDSYYLTETSLNYECSLRNINSDKNLIEKRTALNDFFAKEDSNDETPAPSNLLYNCVEELSQIQNLLDWLNSLINKIEKDTLPEDYNKLKSNLIHAQRRLYSIIAFSKDKDGRLEAINFCKIIDSIKDRLFSVNVNNDIDQQYKLFNASSSSMNPKHDNRVAKINHKIAQVNDKIAHLDDPEDSDDSSYHSPTRETHRTSSEVVKERQFSLKKWDLKFTGDPGSLPVKEFLSRLKIFAQADEVSLNSVAKKIAQVLDGSAMSWLRIRERPFTYWTNFESEFCSRFLPRDHDFVQLEKIRSAKQLQSEKFTDFYTRIELMFRELNVPELDKVKLDIITRNLHHIYSRHLILNKPNSITDLFKKCKDIEEDPSTQYLQRQNKTFTKPTNFENRKPSNPTSTQRNVDSSKLTCWNCHVKGHTFPNCSKDLSKFCYKCGNPNFTTKTCPKCSKNVKGRSG